MNKYLKHATLLSIVFYLLSIFVFPAQISLAADTVLNELNKLPSDIDCSVVKADNYSDDVKAQIKQYCGDYELNDFVGLAIKVSQIILGLTGSLALLFFIYGGAMFLISGGSSERVTTAKNIIVGAVVGIFIIFTSYMIIGFVFKATGADIKGTAWSSTDWFNK